MSEGVLERAVGTVVAPTNQTRTGEVLAWVGSDHPAASDLRRALRGLGLAVAGDVDRLSALKSQDVLVLAGNRGLTAERVALLDGWLRAGGGLVTVGAIALASLASNRMPALAGWLPAGRAPLTEVMARSVAGHAVTARLDGEIPFPESILLADDPPPGASPILTVSWHFHDQALAFELAVGTGHWVHIGLGENQASLREPAFLQLLRRCVARAAGRPPAAPLGVGLLGYGAIGREHATAVEEVEGLRLVAVCDRAQERRDRARAAFDVHAHAELDDFLADSGVDLVVVGTPPNAHTAAVLSALAAGKHVVCDKPLALTSLDAASMIEAAAQANRVLTVYQNRRWDPDFVALRRAASAGEVGEPFYMESFIGGFSHPCQFWHSHEPVSGGTIYDWGSHYFDWILQLMPGRVIRVEAQAHKRVWHDVTNSDQVRVDLTLSGGRQALFLQSDIAAAIKPKWYLLGTSGSIVGDWRLETIKGRSWGGDLIEEALAPAESPAELTLFQPGSGGGVDRKRLALAPRRQHAFYRSLADHLLMDEPLTVRPEESLRAVAVMEAATRSIAQGGRALRVNI